MRNSRNMPCVSVLRMLTETKQRTTFHATYQYLNGYMMASGTMTMCTDTSGARIYIYRYILMLYIYVYVLHVCLMHTVTCRFRCHAVKLIYV